MYKLILAFLISFVSYSQIVSYQLDQTWTKSQVEQVYSNYGIPSEAGDVNFGVDGYKILYFTPDHNGELVLCSGAIFLPKNTICPSPVLAWQHGTTASDQWVPSNISSDNNVIGTLGASQGYIVIMSDFIGLGDGVGFHNYVHADTEASSTIDLILFGKEFAYGKGVDSNDQLFLMGYSQGGHATMAAVREIEENYADQLQITASAPMAGPYDMSGAQREMLEAGQPYPNPGYLPYVLFAYNNIYGLYDDISDVLVAPYDSFLFGMYSGDYSMYEINQVLPNVPINIFQPDYYEEYLNNPDHPFKLALMDNDVYDFTPQNPMRILHCNGDDNVAYENAEVAYNAFVAAGAEDVTLVDGGNYDHSECASLAIIGGKVWIDSMAQICAPEQIDIEEEEFNKNRKLVYTVDVLGRAASANNEKQPLIYFFDDGTYEKRFAIFNGLEK
tara:strand:- start:177 stop:1508 length:1332 start_codon:yes stop_codon:yes gene_type:complete